MFQRFCYPAILKSKFLVQTVLTCLEEFLALTRVENLVKLSFVVYSYYYYLFTAKKYIGLHFMWQTSDMKDYKPHCESKINDH